MKLSDFAHLFDAKFSHDCEFLGISIDTRRLKKGELFFALRGEKHDGAQFIDDAVAKGASAIICKRPCNLSTAVPLIEVEDPLHTLADMAKCHRERLKIKPIAVTGSNGKTTVKEMIAAILPQPSFATQGNLNNHIGAPLSVLNLLPKQQYAVFELGASRLGDIAYTAAIVQPQVALINNIAPAHIEGFGSLDGVAIAKGEIYAALPDSGIAVVNADSEYAQFWDDIIANKSVIYFSVKSETDLWASDITVNSIGYPQFTMHTPIGNIKIVLQVMGEHQVANALAAASCCYALGLSLDIIAGGLESFCGVKGRMNFLQGLSASVVIDDTYNANMRSTMTAVDVLARCKGRKVLVFGDMGELGSYSQEHHREIGLYARQNGVDTVFTCGADSFHTSAAFGLGGQHFENHMDLLEQLKVQLADDVTVLVKGSRSSAMERVVQEIIKT